MKQPYEKSKLKKDLPKDNFFNQMEYQIKAAIENTLKK